MAESAALAKGTTLACIKKEKTHKNNKKKLIKIPQNSRKAQSVALRGAGAPHLALGILPVCAVSGVALCSGTSEPILMEEMGLMVPVAAPA